MGGTGNAGNTATGQYLPTAKSIYSKQNQIQFENVTPVSRSQGALSHFGGLGDLRQR